MDLSLWQLLIGTLSGFVIAFFAEPVKTFFTNRAQKELLRLAIYREIAANYLLLHSLKEKHRAPAGMEGRVGTGSNYIIDNLHLECYQHIIGEKPIEFYQLEESSTISLIYARTSAIVNFITGPTTGENVRSDTMVDGNLLRFITDEIGGPLLLGNMNTRMLRKASRDLWAALEKNKRSHIGNELGGRGDIHHEVLSKIPPDQYRDEYVVAMLEEILIEVMKGKTPEKAARDLKFVPGKYKPEEMKMGGFVAGTIPMQEPPSTDEQT